ncbi:MAG: DUF2842 domain-containing protein [Alphaproteobacteria bacterium]
MQIRARKFIGTLMLTAVVLVYALVAMLVGTVAIAHLPGWTHFIFYAIAGLAWLPLAMVIISWMQKPQKS